MVWPLLLRWYSLGKIIKLEPGLRWTSTYLWKSSCLRLLLMSWMIIYSRTTLFFVSVVKAGYYLTFVIISQVSPGPFRRILRSSLGALSFCIWFLWGCRRGSCIFDPYPFMAIAMIWAIDETIVVWDLQSSSHLVVICWMVLDCLMMIFHYSRSYCKQSPYFYQNQPYTLFPFCDGDSSWA